MSEAPEGFSTSPYRKLSDDEIAYLRRQKSELEARISEASSSSDIVAMMSYQSRFEIISEKLGEAERQDAQGAETFIEATQGE
jgi:hypothetical protein